MKQQLHVIFYTIFWVWNVTFLLLTYGGILPIVGFPLIAATFAGDIPLDFFFSLITLIAVPTVFTLLGVWRFRKQPLQLIRLFYGAEAPLFLLCLLRVFLLRELTPASAQILGTAVICSGAFTVELLWGYAKQNRALAWLQLLSHSLTILVSLYVGILFLFYAFPIVAGYLYQFFSLGWLTTLEEMMTSGELWAIFWWVPLLFFAFCLGSTLFLALPVAQVKFYLHSWHRISKAFASQYGRLLATFGSLSAIAAWIALFISLHQQPQIQTFKLLENAAPNPSQRQELTAKSDALRSGLLNAYLFSYRYLSTREENNHIRKLYRDFLNLPDATCLLVQNAYNYLTSPFLYDGKRADSQKAAKLYAQFFDAPIKKAEQPAIQRAIQSTYKRDEAKLTLLDVSEKKVWLERQEVKIQERGDWADVELYEEYDNQTPDKQQVFYYFTLPETAVVTGLWLGNSDNRTKRLPFTISPRDATQRIYNPDESLQVNPALIEQVGLGNYRLRIYPIPPRSSESQKLHLWLTYKVMQREGTWPLPQLAEKRNIFWTKETKRVINGKEVALEAVWLPPEVPATKRQPTLRQVNLPGGYRMEAKPLSARDKNFPKQKRFAIVLDSSRSMAAHIKELNEAFKWLKEKGFADSIFANNDADLYVTAAAGGQPKRLNDIRFFEPEKINFYGSLKFKEMLLQFVEWRGDTYYDAIILLTDEGRYDLLDDGKVFPVMSAPLWIVHLGGVPRAYDYPTMKAIQQSRGGVSVFLPEVFEKMATKAKMGSSVASVADGYVWLMQKPSLDWWEEESETDGALDAAAKSKATSAKGFEPLAARQLILGLSNEMKPAQLAELGTIHELAKQFKIVTPYSSMLVLDNARPIDELALAEASGERFEREVESQQAPRSKSSNILEVPEPNAGLVVGIAAIALVLFRWLGESRRS